VTRPLLTIGGGLLLAVAYTASPLGLLFLAATPLLCLIAGRGLPEHQRRILTAILASALVARLLAVIAMFLVGIPHHSDLAVGALSGDEAYNLGRALRIRDIMLGFGGTHYDYFVATDEYGRTSYLELLTRLQLAFGPAPYGLRLFNALLFTTGAAVLFRMVRPAFGATAAFLGLVGVLFLPSVFYSSISLLKESLYFLATTVVLASAVRLLRGRGVSGMLLALVAMGGSLWVLDDLRRGAIILATAGIATAVVMRFAFASRQRAAWAVAAAVVVGGIALTQPPFSDRVLEGVTRAGRQHSGHVFTVGHAYKLLDAGFYMNPATPASSSINLTPPQAVRFVIRGLVSFVLTPLPWQAASRGELAFLPEHLLWYVLLVTVPFGLIAGWRRDPLVTAVLIGFVLPTALVLALTNGNVGTLLRLRGLVTPYLMWIGVLGMCVIGEALVARRLDTTGRRAWTLAPEGTEA
jgi:hypothetical protein